MTRKAVLVAIAVFAVLAVLAAIFIGRQDSEETVSETAIETAVTGEDLAAGDKLAMDLFFPSTGGWLRTERRELPASAEPEAAISAVVSSLLAGPGGSGMRAPLPAGTSVRKVYLAADGVAFVDFESPESAPPASGSQREMLTVYSLVNTVLLNFQELDRVVLLWNGRQLKTFAGHVDTMRPLAANTGLIVRDAGRDAGTTS